MKNTTSFYTSPLTSSTVRYLRSAPGKILLSDAEIATQQGINAQLALRKNHPADACQAALHLIDLRIRARDKFPLSREMFFDRDGYEMATRAEVAKYRAKQLQNSGDILDLCCGIGGDLIFLSEHSKVTAVDSCKPRIEMARLNCEIYERTNVYFAVGDANNFHPRFDTIFLDPARRNSGQRYRHSHYYDPPLSLAKKLLNHTNRLIIKIGPAIPEQELPSDAKVEFVSSGGQCREGVLFWGETPTSGRSATVLPGPHTISEDNLGSAAVDLPGAYLYDPDPAVVRAHLINELARKLDAWKLDQHVAYLSGNHPIKTPFARCYRVIDMMPFGVKTLRQYLRKKGFFPAQIKRRRFPMEPIEIERAIKVSTGDIPVVIVLSRLESKPMCIICENNTI